MKYEEPNLRIFMTKKEDVIRTSGDEDYGIEIAPGVVPDENQDNSGYH